jgi:hypothetical protein
MAGRQMYLGETSRVGSESVIGTASGMGIMIEVTGRHVLVRELVIGTRILISMATDFVANERVAARQKLAAWRWETLIDLLVQERGRTGFPPQLDANDPARD